MGNRIVQRGGAYLRYRVAQRGGDQVRVTADQHHGAAMCSHRAFKVFEVGTLAVATGDQHKLAVDISAEPFDGSQCGTHVGGLGIVVVAHAIEVAYPLAAMLEAAEGAQARQHRIKWQADGVTQRQGRQCIGLVVRATDFQFTYRHQVLEFESQVFLAVLFANAEGFEIRFAQAKGPAGHAFAHQRTAQGILAVDHKLPGTTENPVLGQVVRRQAAVAVHVVFTHVQHGGDFSPQIVGGFELEARQFHHVQLDVVAEQVQRWRAEVTAHGHALAGRSRHLADQGGHGAFRVGAADGHDRCLRIARKQVDVAGQLHATRRCRLQGRCRQGQAGAHVELIGAAQKLDIQLATTHFHVRVVTAQRDQLRWIFRVSATANDVPRFARKRTRDMPLLPRPTTMRKWSEAIRDTRFYLSFRVARPTSTRITVMIQKRTITRGSGQPLSSKW